MLIHHETFFPSYLYCNENGRHFSLLAAVTLPKCKPDKFSPGSMSDGTSPTSALLLAGMAFLLAAQGQHHPGDRRDDKGWPLVLPQAVPTTAPDWTRGSCPPCFEMLGSHPHKPGGVGSRGVGLGLHEHEKGESPALPHSTPIGPYGPGEKSDFSSLVIAL